MYLLVLRKMTRCWIRLCVGIMIKSGFGLQGKWFMSGQARMKCQSNCFLKIGIFNFL